MSPAFQWTLWCATVTRASRCRVGVVTPSQGLGPLEGTPGRRWWRSRSTHLKWNEGISRISWSLLSKSITITLLLLSLLLLLLLYYCYCYYYYCCCYYHYYNTIVYHQYCINHMCIYTSMGWYTLYVYICIWSSIGVSSEVQLSTESKIVSTVVST